MMFRTSLAALIAVLTVAVTIAQRGEPSEGAGPFVNVAAAAGVSFQHVNGSTPERHLAEIMGSGGLFFDYDNDGAVDIFLVDGGSLTDNAVNRRARHRLFRNRGNGTFTDVTAASGIAHGAYGMGACAGDYDNDGWPDLYVTSVGPNTLYHNEKGRSFSDVTRAAGVGGAPVFSTSCAFTDIDGDGRVDLMVVNYVDARADNNIFCGDAARQLRIYCHPLNFAPLQSVLYRNNGDGTFADISRAAGIAAQRGNGLGIVAGDYDDDGRPDIFVANDTTPNFLYHNEAGGTFREAALASGVSVASDGKPRAGMGTDFGDVDGDGRLDLFVTNHEFEAHTLFHNLGDGLFEDVTFRSGITAATLPLVGFGAVLFDADNDRDLDLAIVNGHVMNSPAHFRPGAHEAQRKLLLRNDSGRFRDVSRASGSAFAGEAIGRGLAAADIDNDGDLDLLVTNNGGAAELLRNDASPSGGALIVRLIGTRSNHDAIGARLRLTTAGVTQMREVKAGSSYLSQSDTRVHFGLGGAGRIDRLDVRWPGGRVETITGAAANEVITITEGKGITQRKALTRR